MSILNTFPPFKVLRCVQDALVASGNQQVVRAAIQTLHMILKGLGQRCIEVCNNQLILIVAHHTTGTG